MVHFPSRKDEQKIAELFSAVEKLKVEFESIERPTLEIETPTQMSETPFSDRSNKSPLAIYKQAPDTPEYKKNEAMEKNTLPTKVEITNLVSEYEKFDGEDSPDVINAEEINDWEFDALDKD